MRCRVCAREIPEPAYREKTLEFADFSGGLNPEKLLYVCPDCGHGTSPDISDIDGFYDGTYQFQLNDEAEDQLYEVRNGEPFYRFQRQVELVLEHAPPASGTMVLDYGCAKALTLKELLAQRPNVIPAVFDVSTMYTPLWDKWVAREHQACHRCPDDWTGRFDLVTAHFVLEHVEEPVGVLEDIARLLAPGGKAFLSFPNVAKNPGDILVVEHLSHFTSPSALRAIADAGLMAETVLEDAYRGAFVVVASRGSGARPERPEIDAATAGLMQISDFWTGATRQVEAALARHGDRPAAVYGAGFYGVFIAKVLAGRQNLVGHLDRNPFVRDAAPVSPVFDPLDAPDDIEVVYAGVNPRIARKVLDEWQSETGRKVEVVLLEDA